MITTANLFYFYEKHDIPGSCWLCETSLPYGLKYIRFESRLIQIKCQFSVSSIDLIITGMNEIYSSYFF